MPQGARVDSLETLRAFKAVLWKFQEAAQVALADAEAEANRMLMWVENEQDAYWQGQIRKAEQYVVRCKEAVRMKQLFKDSAGRQQSAVDEEKALRIAVKKLAEAQAKHVLVRKWARQLQKEIEMYKGGVQRFTTSVFSEVPNAAAHLESLAGKLDSYLSVQPASVGSGLGEAGSGVGPMARGGDSGGERRETLAQLIPEVPEVQRRELTELHLNLQPPGYDVPVLFQVSHSVDLLQFERDEAGWKVFEVGYAGLFDEARSVRAGELIAGRADLGEMLSLPVGFSVKMDRSGVVEVLDPGRQPVWRRPDREDAPQQAV